MHSRCAIPIGSGGAPTERTTSLARLRAQRPMQRSADSLQNSALQQRDIPGQMLRLIAA
ncbi:putative peptide of unknwon function [Xanthomonas campestris pv. campestris]|uniref:Peptide of unknwon function n=1 Tax=Xanthomonas campestris pv. campestris (strain B100) TaxID=509169 RepID=B0RQW7_XANCB|nr:putative peptide of unknwon function [Xanthomonas campestris pv. campestris]